MGNLCNGICCLSTSVSKATYFAFDVGYMIIESFSLEKLFFIPTVFLFAFWFIDLFIVRNTPGEAGFDDFDTADASSGDDGPRLGAAAVFKLMLRSFITFQPMKCMVL